MQDGRKVHTDSYMASNGSCFILIWTSFKNRMLEVGLTQNHWESMALRTLMAIDLFSHVLIVTNLEVFSLLPLKPPAPLAVQNLEV